jgi:diapolycopene oxygenase
MSHQPLESSSATARYIREKNSLRMSDPISPLTKLVGDLGDDGMRAVIIGAGVAGLAAAARLASSGHEVIVLEKNAFVGGKISESGSRGYRFDLGPSLFTLPNELDDVFEAAGKDPRSYYEYVRLATCGKYYFNDGTTVVAHANIDEFAREVETHLQTPQTRVRAYLEHAARLYSGTAPLFIGQSLHRSSTYLSAQALRTLCDLPLGSLVRTLHEVNARWFDDPRLVQLFDRFATYNGSDPHRASGILSQIPHLEHGIGAYFPVGGMIAIPRALERLCRDLGVHFMCNTPVKRIRHAENKVLGVDTARGFYGAELVVCASDIVGAYKDLLPDTNAPSNLLTQERSSSAVIFYWGIRARFPELDVHNVFFSSDYRREFADIFERQTVPDDPTVYVHVSSKLEANDAPLGCENWFVMINTAPDFGQPWDQLVPQLRTRVLKRLKQALGRTIEPLIDTEMHLDPRGIEERTSSFRGALYGSSSNSAKAAFLRHPNFSRKIRGLFFCGGSVHPGGGIPLCLSSAEIVSREVSRLCAKQTAAKPKAPPRSVSP